MYLTHRFSIVALTRATLLIIQLLVGLAAVAQTLGSFTTITSGEGLSENNIRSVLQLPDGRMVFVNEGMINLYNGSTFSYLHLHENLSYPLPGYQGFHRLYSENPERLWMKRHGQLTLINIAKESNEGDLAAKLRSLGVNVTLSDFFMDADHNLWFITSSGKIYLKKHQESVASFFIGLQRISDQDPIADISSYGNTVFFFLRSGMVVAYNIDQKRELYRLNSLEGKDADNYQGTTYAIRGDKRLYVLRNDKRGILMVFDVAKRTWKKVLETPYTLNTLSMDPKGSLVVSVNSGIWSIGNDLKTLKYYPSLQLADGRTIHTEISTATYDDRGGLWLGTLNKGLLYYDPKSYRLTQVYRVSFPTHEQKELNITSFAELPNSKEILVGTDHGIFVYDPVSGSIKKWQIMPDNISCISMFKDAKGILWLSCNTGLFRYGQSSCQKMNGTAWKKLLIDKKGRCFATDRQDKLFTLDSNTGRATAVVFSIKGNSVQAYASDIALFGNDLYGINTKGLFKYNVWSKKIEIIAFKKNKIFHQLNNLHFSSLAIDSGKRLWIGTQDGLNIYDLTKHSLTELHSEDGMVNNEIKAVIFDYRGNAWVTTAYGLSKVKFGRSSTAKVTFTNFTKTDGVIAEQFNERASLKLKNGQILLGGIDGFNLLDPNKYNAGMPLKPIFTELNVQGMSVKPGIKYDGTQILDRSATVGGVVTLNHHQNFFTVSFSGLNYANPSRTVYRYTLEGANDTWHETDPANGIGNATYTNLVPGKYRLQVQASADGEGWSSQISSLNIVIKTPWWRTLPMLVIYWITGLALAGGAWFYFDRRRRAKELLLQEKRLNEMKFTFFTNVSHELRTPLTLILTPLGIILKKLDQIELKDQLQGIYNNATQLLSMVDQLLDLRRVQTEKEQMHLTISDLFEDVKLLCEPFNELAASKNITFEIQTSNHLWLYLDNEKLRIIINNLLSNAFKFTPAGGSIVIRIGEGHFPDTQKEAAIIKIQDSGKGIASTDIPHLFNRFFQGSNNLPGETKGSGIGLSLVQECVHLHGGTIEVKSKIGEGTTFLVYLPYEPPLTIATTEDVLVPPKEFSKQVTKVLVVEDNIELRRLITGSLRLHYQVIEAGNGKQALDQIATDAPDLIISDLMMPQMDGLELCTAVKINIHTSHLPFILLTAKGSEQAQFEGYRVKADAYITKPFNMDMLLLQVANLLETQEKRKALFHNSIVIPLHLASASDVDEKFIKKLLECIEENLANSNYSVEDLSGDMHMERSGLYRKVVAVTGQVPSLFIRTIRLKKAAQLLLQKQHSVARIAEMTGFGSAAYFSKCFLDEFGVKPSEYYAHQSTKVQ